MFPGSYSLKSESKVSLYKRRINYVALPENLRSESQAGDEEQIFINFLQIPLATGGRGRDAGSCFSLMPVTQTTPNHAFKFFCTFIFLS